MYCNHCGFQQNVEGARFCNACGNALPMTAQQPAAPPTAVQSIVTPPAQKKSRLVWYIVAGSLAFFSIFAAFASLQGSKARVSRAPSLATETSSNSLGIKLEPAPTPENWSYYDRTDDMTGKLVTSATVTSTNTVNFDSPYQGAQHARLTLRKHPRYGSDVILSIEKGQFMAGVSGVQVLVRFDEGTAIKFWAMGAEDNSTTSLFLGNYAKFVAAAKKAKVVRISTPVYQEGSPVFEFNIEGLKDQ